MRLMAFPRSLAATLSLIMIATPGRTCDNLPAGQGVAGFPCGGQAVAQDRDLSFSIRSADRAASHARCGNAADRRPAIAIGSGVKADALIFSGSSSEEKEVSDASRR
jgi:hypothetical protein